MSKPTFVISCPIDTYSGYGARSRDVVKAIIALDKFNVKVMPQRWGSTPWNYIKDHSEWSFLNDHMLPFQQPLTAQPDYWMQITIPSEFQPIGKYNIGVTAGIETTLCHPSWLDGLNRMDLNLVSSKHAKYVFEHTQAQEPSQNNQPGRLIKLTKPVEVLLEGADLDVYKTIDKFENKELFNQINNIPESFAYLFVGHWLPGAFGEDRKNVSATIKTFLETFKNKHNSPALILKTTITSNSKIGKEEILSKINSIKKSVDAKILPNIYVLMGEMHDSEINELYNHPKVKAMVCLTKGEGFGRPLLEFALVGKPILSTGWSGHIDFLKPEYTSLVGGEMKPVHESAANDWLIKESSWLAPDMHAASQIMQDMASKNYKSFVERAKRQKHFCKTNFAFANMQADLKKYMDAAPVVSKEVKLELPKLQRIDG